MLKCWYDFYYCGVSLHFIKTISWCYDAMKALCSMCFVINSISIIVMHASTLRDELLASGRSFTGVTLQCEKKYFSLLLASCYSGS